MAGGKIMIFDYHFKQAENNNDADARKQKIGNDINNLSLKGLIMKAMFRAF